MDRFTRTSVVVLLLLAGAMTTGCAPSAKDKLVGKWSGGVQIDDEAVQQRLKEKGNNPIASAIAAKMIEAFGAGTMDFDLKADGSYTSSTKLGPFSKDTYGTWEVVEEEATQATIRFTSHEGEFQDATILFSDQDVITAPFTGEGAGLGEFRCTRVPDSDGA